MNNWENLVKTALLGTHREAYTQDLEESALERLLEPLKESGPAHRLLCTAGTMDLYEQVGRSPEKMVREVAMPSLPVDNRSPCCARASYYLSRMLGGPYRNLLPEFLLALQRSGQRLPDTLVPNILAHGAKTSANRPYIIPLLSLRDRQLAAQNPAWTYASPDLDSWSGLRRIWTDLPPVKRQALIKQLRSSHADQARELMASSWKIDHDNQRIRLLKALQEGLNMKDEPFLETALDDRNQQIRQHAAELLAFLPHSRLSQRMTGRVSKFLNWTPDQEQRIAVRFPVISPTMVRDGVVGSKSKQLARIRAQHLIQVVGAVPLSYWTTYWHQSPQAILEAVTSTNWTRTLFAGLSWAAYRQGDAPWAKAILWQRGLEGATSKLVNLLLPGDYALLIERIMDEETGSDPLSRSGPLVTALRRWDQPFDTQLTHMLLPIFADHFSQEQEKRAPGSLVRSAFLNLARTCPPTELPFAEEILGPLTGTVTQWRSTVMEFNHILRFRQEMLNALESDQQKAWRTNVYHN